MSAFFILSTGRAGTQSIAHALSQSVQTLCLHEPDPSFVRSTTLYASGLLSRRAMANKIRGSRPLVEVPHYGETNNRFALVLEPLTDVFPDARFIWVRRDGRAFVCSQLQRGAYGTPLLRPGVSTWERWRPRGDAVGAMSHSDWAALDPFARICWVWAWTNAQIERGLQHRSVLVVHTHELSDRIQEIAHFLGLPKDPYIVPRSNARQAAVGVHPNAVERIQRAADWSPAQHSSFETWCGPTMDRYFPGWREAEQPVRTPRAPLSVEEEMRCALGVERVSTAERRLQAEAVRRSPVRRLAGWLRR